MYYKAWSTKNNGDGPKFFQSPSASDAFLVLTKNGCPPSGRGKQPLVRIFYIVRGSGAEERVSLYHTLSPCFPKLGQTETRPNRHGQAKLTAPGHENGPSVDLGIFTIKAFRTISFSVLLQYVTISQRSSPSLPGRVAPGFVRWVLGIGINIASNFCAQSTFRADDFPDRPPRVRESLPGPVHGTGNGHG